MFIVLFIVFFNTRRSAPDFDLRDPSYWISFQQHLLPHVFYSVAAVFRWTANEQLKEQCKICSFLKKNSSLKVVTSKNLLFIEGAMVILSNNQLFFEGAIGRSWAETTCIMMVRKGGLVQPPTLGQEWKTSSDSLLSKMVGGNKWRKSCIQRFEKFFWRNVSSFVSIHDIPASLTIN